jgi:hypothetical protein
MDIKTMKNYNPDRAIDPLKWNNLDESEHQHLVERYHRKKRIEIPNLHVHVIIHVIVESQVALDEEIPVKKTLERLMLEGLCRHDGIHAIGSVLAAYIFDLLKHDANDQDINANYYRQLEELTAESWLKSANEEMEDELE